MKTPLTKPRRQDGFTIIELLVATAILSVILLLVTTMMINIGNLFYKGINQNHVQDSVRDTTDEVSQLLELSSTNVRSGVDATTGANSVPVNVYCVGNTRYSYVTDVEIGHQRLAVTGVPNGSATYHDVLWRDIPTGGCSPTVAADLTSATLSTTDAATDAAELIPPDSRLTDFCIGTIDSVTGACDAATASPYTITVGMAYGGDNLLCDNGYTDNSNLADCNYESAVTKMVSPHMIQIINNTVNPIPPDQLICKGTSADRFCATANLSTTVANRL